MAQVAIRRSCCVPAVLFLVALVLFSPGLPGHQALAAGAKGNSGPKPVPGLKLGLAGFLDRGKNWTLSVLSYLSGPGEVRPGAGPTGEVQGAIPNITPIVPALKDYPVAPQAAEIPGSQAVSPLQELSGEIQPEIEAIRDQSTPGEGSSEAGRRIQNHLSGERQEPESDAVASPESSAGGAEVSGKALSKPSGKPSPGQAPKDSVPASAQHLGRNPIPDAAQYARYRSQRLPNPLGFFLHAYSMAAAQASSLGKKAEHVHFLQATASWPGEASWNFTFLLIDGRSPADMLSVSFSRADLVASGAEAEISDNPNLPNAYKAEYRMSQSLHLGVGVPQGSLPFPMNAYLFGKGALVSPDFALELARTQGLAEGGVSVSFRMREEPESGDKDPWYHFYDDRGSELIVNGRTGELRVLSRQGLSQSPGRWARWASGLGKYSDSFWSLATGSGIAGFVASATHVSSRFSSDPVKFPLALFTATILLWIPTFVAGQLLVRYSPWTGKDGKQVPIGQALTGIAIGGAILNTMASSFTLLLVFFVPGAGPLLAKLMVPVAFLAGIVVAVRSWPRAGKSLPKQ